jgi:hypothetical protein
MKGILTLAQLREARSRADLQAELASGRVRAIGPRNGRQSESIPRETWAHYRVYDDFDSRALFINPHVDPLDQDGDKPVDCAGEIERPRRTVAEGPTRRG